MASHATLPFEIRLQIYEILLAEWCDAPAIWTYPQNRLHWQLPIMPMVNVRMPVPAVLQAEAGEARSRLLKWLAKHKRISPDKSTPTLRFSDRSFKLQHDFVYLQSPSQMDDFAQSVVMECIERKEAFKQNLGFEFEFDEEWTAPRRIALLASTCDAKFPVLPYFLKNLGVCLGLQELAIVFVELDQGELRYIKSVPKKNPAAYTLEQLSDGDIKDYRQELRGSVDELVRFIRPMLGFHSRHIKITTCKMIPRI